MINESSGTIEMPKFIKVLIVTSKKKDETLGIKVPVYRVYAKISPPHISSYYETVYEEADTEKPGVVVYVGSISYIVDMTMAAFDKLMDSVDRNINIQSVESVNYEPKES